VRLDNLCHRRKTGHGKMCPEELCDAIKVTGRCVHMCPFFENDWRCLLMVIKGFGTLEA